jgi:hypothetical protein
MSKDMGSPGTTPEAVNALGRGHTPGPWVVFTDSVSDRALAILPAMRRGEVCEFAKAPEDADARLIAAAPDLLGALKAICGAVASGDVAGCLIHHSPTGWANTGDALAKAEAAIAKAEGK